jgi:hypothetical protein
MRNVAEPTVGPARPIELTWGVDENCVLDATTIWLRELEAKGATIAGPTLTLRWIPVLLVPKFLPVLLELGRPKLPRVEGLLASGIEVF